MQPFRQQFVLILCIIYLVPIFFLTFYGLSGESSAQKAWLILSLGLLITVIGLIILFLKLLHWEKEWSHKEKLFKDSLLSESEALRAAKEIKEEETLLASDDWNHSRKEWEEKEKTLFSELEEKQVHCAVLEKNNAQLKLEVQQALAEAEDKNQALQKQLEELSLAQETFQRSIQDQQTLLEKKQQEISQLENKIQDLTYEVKTLIHLAKLETTDEDSKN